jgi:Asp-tRNA(Asn)/Glu-tRNA(Gln) amidotransferase B subunit
MAVENYRTMELEEVVDLTMKDHPELVKRAFESTRQTPHRTHEILAVVLKRRQGFANPSEVVDIIENRLKGEGNVAFQRASHNG